MRSDEEKGEIDYIANSISALITSEPEAVATGHTLNHQDREWTATGHTQLQS
jgi:hypothetical protein